MPLPSSQNHNSVTLNLINSSHKLYFVYSLELLLLTHVSRTALTHIFILHFGKSVGTVVALLFSEIIGQWGPTCVCGLSPWRELWISNWHQDSTFSWLRSVGVSSLRVQGCFSLLVTKISATSVNWRCLRFVPGIPTKEPGLADE